MIIEYNEQKNMYDCILFLAGWCKLCNMDILAELNGDSIDKRFMEAGSDNASKCFN